MNTLLRMFGGYMNTVNLNVVPRQVVRLQNKVTPNVIRQIARCTGEPYSEVKDKIADIRNPREPLAQLLALKLAP